MRGHGDPSGETHLGSSLKNLGNDGSNLIFTCAALEEGHRSPSDKSNDRGHCLNLEGLCDRWSLVDVHLDELEGTRMLTRYLFKQRQRRLLFM